VLFLSCVCVGVGGVVLCLCVCVRPVDLLTLHKLHTELTALRISHAGQHPARNPIGINTDGGSGSLG